MRRKYATEEERLAARYKRNHEIVIPQLRSSREKNYAAGLCRCGRERITGSTQCEKCHKRSREYNFNYRYTLRMQALAAYGGKCVCCGESTPEFLQFDHKNNDGYLHRQNNNVRGGISLWLQQNNYPDTIQLLCGNCHSAKSFYGNCPHGTMPQETSSASTCESSDIKCPSSV